VQRRRALGHIRSEIKFALCRSAVALLQGIERIGMPIFAGDRSTTNDASAGATSVAVSCRLCPGEGCCLIRRHNSRDQLKPTRPSIHH